uniref:VHL domain-containing protein n=1 Tax=Steinernema glaseri TaxID=37863 RepID=A0A1I7Y8T9_9BILA
MSDRAPSSASDIALVAKSPSSNVGQIPACLPPSFGFGQHLPGPYGAMSSPWPPHYLPPFNHFAPVLRPSPYMVTENPPFYVNSANQNAQVVHSSAGQIPACIPFMQPYSPYHSTPTQDDTSDRYGPSPETPIEENYKPPAKRRKKSLTRKEKKGKKRASEGESTPSKDQEKSPSPSGSAHHSNTSTSAEQAAANEQRRRRFLVKHEMFVPKGTFLFRLADYGTSRDNTIWLVDNYRLINKYEHVYSPQGRGTAVYAPTNRFAGWVSTDTESYHVLQNVVNLEDGLVEVEIIPEEVLKERHSLMLEHLKNLTESESSSPRGIKQEEVDETYESTGASREQIDPVPPNDEAMVRIEGPLAQLLFEEKEEGGSVRIKEEPKDPGDR